MKNLIEKEPVVTAAGVAALLGVLLSLVGLEVSNEALQEWGAALVAVISGVVYIVGAYAARNEVTPLVDPKDKEGRRLSPTIQRAPYYGDVDLIRRYKAGEELTPEELQKLLRGFFKREMDG